MKRFPCQGWGKVVTSEKQVYSREDGSEHAWCPFCRQQAPVANIHSAIVKEYKRHLRPVLKG